MENNKELQIENGNYTRIVNKVLDELVKTPLLGAELAICLFVIRKTYGYSKLSDQISLSQFEAGINRSRPTVTKALKNLQLVNILQLVKVGNSKQASSVWKFNKYYKTWKLVKTSELVKDRTSTSKEKLKKLVKVPLHTKDNTKEITKDSPKSKTSDKKVKIIKFTAEDVEMVQLLVGLIQKNNPAWKMKGNPDTWATDMNKLRRIDGYTRTQIEYMIRWTQKDSFWSQNILSASKLREKFNDLIPRLKEIKSKSQQPNYVL